MNTKWFSECDEFLWQLQWRFHNLKNKMSMAVCILSWFFYLWKFLLMMKIFVWIYSPHSVTAPLLFQWKRVRRRETIIVNIWDICWLLVGRDSVQLSIPYTILFCSILIQSVSTETHMYRTQNLVPPHNQILKYMNIRIPYKKLKM